MPFINVKNFPYMSPPGRLYIHEDGSKDVFHGDEERAVDYFFIAVDKNKELLSDIDYFLAAVWGDVSKNEKVADVFGYTGIDNWPGNPEVYAWTLKEGVYVPSNAIACGDMLIMLGKEEEYTRSRKNAYEYLNILPKNILNI